LPSFSAILSTGKTELKLLNQKELARRLGKHPITIARATKAGRIRPKYVLSKRTILYDLDEVSQAFREKDSTDSKDSSNR
jgi:predicted transcriptional regulator